MKPVLHEESFLMTFADAKQRFSSRVADYVRYRPGYPAALIEVLRVECGLRPEHSVADVGSGTGILTRLFLENSNQVFGIEPNEEMRLAGEKFLSAYKNFSSVCGSAEATTLPNASVDFVTVAQAFHWFEPNATRREFLRILKPQGWVVVIWNDRRISETAFGRAYEDLLVRYGTDYTEVKEAYPEEKDMENYFGVSVESLGSYGGKKRSKDRPLQMQEVNGVRRFELSNFQEVDFDGLAGRVRSSSYAPRAGDKKFAPMMAALRELFDANQKSGRVRVEYTTQIYFGRLAAMRNPA
jgi:ubiquinone/menaquinone biosynthesis C-methylase UbiE